MTFSASFGQIAIVLTTAIYGFAYDPPTPADKKAVAESVGPESTYRNYIEAIRISDVQAAKKFWVIDDNNKSGVLDVIVGLWISPRQLNQLALKNFGPKGMQAIPKGWRRDDLTDQALDLTQKRLDDVEVKIEGDRAELKIKWKDGDGGDNPAFEFSHDPIIFRKVSSIWKMDANRMCDLERGIDFFKPGSWGPMFRDQVVIMNEAVEGIEKGKLKTAKDLEVFINGKITAMEKKYNETISGP